MIWLVPAAAVLVTAAALRFWLRALAAEADALTTSIRRLVAVSVAVDDLRHHAAHVRRDTAAIQAFTRQGLRPSRALPAPPVG